MYGQENYNENGEIIDKKERKECKIIGYGTFDDKENGTKMLRILIGVKSNSEKYYGLMVAPAVFMEWNENYQLDLKKAIDNENIKCYYETSDNIITGKTKVTKIEIMC